MKTGKILLIIGSVIIVSGGVTAFLLFKKPKISIEEIDHINKTAKIIVGNKKVDYEYKEGMTTNIPNIKPFHYATINVVNDNVSMINIYRFNKNISEYSKKIDFNN